MKKTIEEAKEWGRSIIEIVLSQYDKEIPKLKAGTTPGRWTCIVELDDGWFLQFDVYTRVIGDESFFMWEPGDGDRGLGWMGDEVTVTLDKHGTPHECPSCECIWEGCNRWILRSIDDAKRVCRETK